MSNGNTRVRPGEVISSSLINQILERLEALEGATGPSTGGFEILGFDPTTPIEVGRVLAILGSNLPFPPGAGTVTIGGIPVPEGNLRVATSNRSRIELTVPDLGPLPADGADRIVSVRGGGFSSERAHTFLPSTGVVNPDISLIFREGAPTSVDLIPMGQVAVVQGTGFGATPSANTLTFTVLGVTPTPPPYPRPEGPPLDVQLTSPTEIRVRVPTMSEVPATGNTRIRLGLAVEGSPDAAVAEFLTRP